MAKNNKKEEEKEAYEKIRRGYHSKLELTKKSYLKMKIQSNKDNEKSSFV